MNQGSELGRDAGMSLIEMIVAMALMSVFGVLFTSAIVTMNRTTTRLESLTTTSSDLSSAFLTLDRTVRYASALTSPARSTASGDWYVEYLVTNTGAPVCTQLRVDVTKHQFQQRTWTVTDTGTGPTSAWLPLADAVVVSAQTPFVRQLASGSVTTEQLAINLSAVSGSKPTATTSQFSITLAALNSADTDASAPAPCQQMGRP